jgi:hypothetical protein
MINMDKKKLVSIATLTILIVSILAVANIPITKASPTIMHTASVTPTTTTSPTVQLNFNVTNVSNATEKINKTSILLPSNVINTTVATTTGTWAGVYDDTVHSLNFTADAGSEIATGDSAWFNITMRWNYAPPGTVGFGVDCYKDSEASVNNTKWVYVTFTPQFSATITPTHVKGSTSYIFNITTTNTGSSIGINKINITYPTGWAFNSLVSYSPGTWTTGHDLTLQTFYLTGPNLLIGSSAWIQVNMTSASATQDPGHWNSTAWDIGGTWLGTYDLPVVVDPTAPDVAIDTLPTYYTVGSGNRIWINVTVTDNLNITKYGMTVTTNDTTRFELNSSTKVSDTNYRYFFANKTAISDGPLAINVTATDAAGNMGSDIDSTTVDNTAPRLLWIKVRDQTTAELPYVAGSFWMSATSTGIQVNASFYNPADASGYVYFNTTSETFVNNTWIPTTPYSVVGIDYVILNITVSDTASPTANRFTQKWDIYRDKVLPSAPTFTVEAICGGAIIRSLAATDNVGILSYKVYANGSLLTPAVLKTELEATTLVSEANWVAFSNVLVLNLTAYGGKVANITITAVDYGGNEGNASTPVYYSIPEERWYPIELQEKWNLIGLPLIPASTSRAAVLSLILKQGATGVVAVYGYDNATDTWILNPATMEDGKGYWIYMTAYDVLIVSGRITPPPPALPPSYYHTAGWVLAGYKSIETRTVANYLSSLPNATYFRYIYVWNAVAQSWSMLDRESATPTFTIGQGFWIWMYNDQTMIPPIP